MTVKSWIIIWSVLLSGGSLGGFYFISGCPPDKSAQAGQVIAKINEYELTRDEYESKLVRELEYERNYKSTIRARKEFLDRLIREEVLIQEAVNRDLDKQPEFIQAIEKYWEATLIKTLIEARMNEIRQTTVITGEEVQHRYNELKARKKGIPPLDQVEAEIAKMLKGEKQTAAMDEWETRLKSDAKIKVFEQYL